MFSFQTRMTCMRRPWTPRPRTFKSLEGKGRLSLLLLASRHSRSLPLGPPTDIPVGTCSVGVSGGEAEDNDDDDDDDDGNRAGVCSSADEINDGVVVVEDEGEGGEECVRDGVEAKE